MKALTDPSEVERYQKLAGEMMLTEENQEYHFNLDWVRNHKWKVVPVEDGDHFAPEEIALLVPVLNRAGYNDCIAVATEPLGPYPKCYRLAVSNEDFRNFNAECGPFRYLLTDETRGWAISCNELYNLFAGPPKLLKDLLGRPIDMVRQDYLDFINQPLMDPNGLLHRAAERYAAL